MKLLTSTATIINTYDPNSPSMHVSSETTAGMTILESFDYDIWYCFFSCEHSFKIYKIRDLVPKDVLDKVKSGQAYIVLDNALEPFLKSIDTIYSHLVIEEGIPERQIILMTNMYDALEYTNNLAEKLDRKPIRIMWFKLFEWDLHMVVRDSYKNTQLKTLEFKEYPKKFLNLNRRWRSHRPLLTTLLYQRSLIDKGYISFGPCDQKDTWGHRWPELLHYFRKNPPMLEILESSAGVKDLPPLYLDTNELHINRAVATQDTDHYYLNSYFSVVSETTCLTQEWYPNVRFLSEKTFKAIAMNHPFILVSVPHSLDILRRMGYKTFSPIIDERYDLEEEDSKRMIMIANEIERLANLTPAELEIFLAASKEIVEFNFKNLISKQSFIEELN